MRKSRVKRIGTILFLVVLSFIELCWDMELAGVHTRWPVPLFIVLAVVDLFVEIRKTFDDSKESEQQEEEPELYYRFMEKRRCGFLLSWIRECIRSIPTMIQMLNETPEERRLKNNKL